jgi:hypothetical protein
MKNIHILPTDKSSNLVFEKLSNRFYTNSRRKSNTNNLQNQNVYITSDEQANEGDWGYIPFQGGNIKLVGKYFADDWKKIILTTDQELIADGVQAIDDEFLEWFVKNPSCESVEVDKNWNYPLDKSWEYKLRIIPQEEPKQETLEEAAERLYPTTIDSFTDNGFDLSERERLIFIIGAEWQAERMYSEEEVIELLQKYRFDLSSGKTANIGDTTKFWFEQFKKK